MHAMYDSPGLVSLLLLPLLLGSSACGGGEHPTARPGGEPVVATGGDARPEPSGAGETAIPADARGQTTDAVEPASTEAACTAPAGAFPLTGIRGLCGFDVTTADLGHGMRVARLVVHTAAGAGAPIDLGPASAAVPVAVVDLKGPPGALLPGGGPDPMAVAGAATEIRSVSLAAGHAADLHSIEMPFLLLRRTEGRDVGWSLVALGVAGTRALGTPLGGAGLTVLEFALVAIPGSDVRGVAYSESYVGGSSPHARPMHRQFGYVWDGAGFGSR